MAQETIFAQRAGAPAFQTPQASIQSPQAVAQSQPVAAGQAEPAVSNQASVVVTPVGSKSTVSGGAATIPPSPFEVYTDYNWGNAMAKRLRNAPAKLYNFDRASLRDVMRFLADDAGIPFVAMQESSAAENTLVTFTLRASPFLALETIARANGVSIFYDNGVWFMRPINEQELIARTYKLKFNPQDVVKYTGAQQGQGSGGGGGELSGLDLTLQQPTSVFEVKAPQTVEEIKKLLGIPTSGLYGPNAGETSVENPMALDIPPSLSQSGSKLTEGAPKGDGGAQVIYNADANTIYIVATRQQHQWVEGFLAATDRHQALIGIEIKFLETTKDPTKDLGIDWSETLEGGYGVTARFQGQMQGGVDSTLLNNVVNSFTGSSVTLSPGSNSSGSRRTTNATDTHNKQNRFSAGYAAVLAPEDVTVRLQAFIRDRDTSVVQYPRMLTVNNREVAIRSVVNQPVLGSVSAVNSGANVGTNVAEVVYLPIGTIINVLPRTMPDGSVILNVAITVSRIVDFQNITIQPGQTQEYPVPASRVYNASLQVDSGYTLAVSGLAESTDSRNDTGVPYLKDIPGVGELFKSKSRNHIKKNLIIFITPTVINDRRQTEGIAETPETIVPKRPDEPSPPAFSSGGRLVGGIPAIDEAVAWLELQRRIFKQLDRESMTDKDFLKQLNGVIASANMLVAEIQLQEEQSPKNRGTLVKQEEKALGILGELNELYVGSKKNINEF